VPDLKRRRFLTVLAAVTAAVSGCATAVPERTTAQSTGAPVPPGGPVRSTPAAPVPSTPAGPVPSTPATPVLLPPPPSGSRIPLPGGGALTRLPGHGDLLALTVDDGVSTEVVQAYTQFAKDTGVRLTYFVNGTYRSWTDNLALLAPLVSAGQIQLGNHTWSHPDLTTVSKDRIAEELSRNGRFLKTTYGIEAAPYFRPPYGKHNATVDAVAADLGYTVPTLWSGSLSDSTLISEDYITAMAREYFTAQTIVIGHLNHLPVTHVYPQLVDIIRSRNLRTVTLNDVFLPPQ
jgi:peptidoglycan/xylan/chitin deacetylase (PgdA/CDA1 family)